MSNKDHAQALCNACDDCHGIFSHTSHGDWYYCSKSRGTSHRRGKWGNYEAIFTSCSGKDYETSQDLCYGVAQGGAKGWPCKEAAHSPAESTCTTTGVVSGWACGGSGEGWESCPGWTASSRTDRAQAAKDCAACQDCHGIFSGTSTNRWYYCSKGN